MQEKVVSVLSSPLRTLLNTCDYRQTITTPTTKSDTLRDPIFTNIDPTQTITSTYYTYYSDHDIISIAINKAHMSTTISK